MQRNLKVAIAPTNTPHAPRNHKLRAPELLPLPLFPTRSRRSPRLVVLARALHAAAPLAVHVDQRGVWVVVGVGARARVVPACRAQSQQCVCVRRGAARKGGPLVLKLPVVLREHRVVEHGCRGDHQAIRGAVHGFAEPLPALGVLADPGEALLCKTLKRQVGELVVEGPLVQAVPVLVRVEGVVGVHHMDNAQAGGGEIGHEITRLRLHTLYNLQGPDCTRATRCAHSVLEFSALDGPAKTACMQLAHTPQSSRHTTCWRSARSRSSHVVTLPVATQSSGSGASGTKLP